MHVGNGKKEQRMRCEEIAPTTSSEEDSVERTKELYQNVELKDILPASFFRVVSCFDSIAVSILCLLPCLCGGATVSPEKGTNGCSIILYMLLLAPSGVGKTSVSMLGRKYLLNWLDREFRMIDKANSEDQATNSDVFLVKF